MKAIIYTEYGSPDVLRLAEVAKPVPGAREVLIRVHATSVTAGDCNARGFVFVPPGFGFLPRLTFGLRRPKQPILGVEFSGEVEATGKDVRRFKPGDRVFGTTGGRFGAYAEYIRLAEDACMVPNPAGLSYEQAAAIPFGGTAALYFLRDLAKVQRGQKVLVVGASGCCGAYGVQLARHYGAEVTGVCSTANVELVKSLGAGRVVDYTREDVTQNGETYDVIFDMVAEKNSFSRYKGSLKPEGLYLAGAGGLKEFVQMAWTSLTGGKKVMAGMAPDRTEDLVFLKDLVEAGEIRPVIDRSYPLEAMAEAHRYVDKGHKRGSVVITV